MFFFFLVFQKAVFFFLCTKSLFINLLLLWTAKNIVKDALYFVQCLLGEKLFNVEFFLRFLFLRLLVLFRFRIFKVLKQNCGKKGQQHDVPDGHQTEEVDKHDVITCRICLGSRLIVHRHRPVLTDDFAEASCQGQSDAIEVKSWGNQDIIVCRGCEDVLYNFSLIIESDFVGEHLHTQQRINVQK
jgi:hypothetical protein